MKLKDISFFERHFEKMIIGFALLIMLIVVYFYALDTPNKVEMRANRELGPGEIDQEILRVEAARLSNLLDEEKVPTPLEEFAVPDYRANFADKVGDEPIPGEFAMKFGVDVLEYIPPDRGPRRNIVDPFYVPRIPVLRVVAAGARLDTIDPNAVANDPNLQLVVNADQAPFDQSSISILFEFPSIDMKRELTTLDELGSHQRIPDDWIESFVLADVQVERLEPRPDGTWPMPGDADFAQYVTLLDPPAGQPINPRIIPDALKKAYDREYAKQKAAGVDEELAASRASAARKDLAMQYVKYYRDNKIEPLIVQPAFPILVGDAWTPPEPKAPIDPTRTARENEHGDVLVRFPSPVPTGDEHNDRVAVEWYVARDARWQPLEATAVVVVHESSTRWM